MADKPLYFANKDTKECVQVLINKIENWEDSIFDSGILSKIYKSWKYYHGVFGDEQDISVNSHEILNTGDQGELLFTPVNHFRNIGTHILNLTTANRPAMQARAVNTDTKSQSQTYLANGLLDYYMREKNLENVMKKAVEYAVVLSEGWVKMEWDSTSGDPVGFNEDTNSYVYAGDINYKALHALDVIRDVHRDDSDTHDWYIVKSYKNKYDLMAKYPEFADEIKGVETRDASTSYTLAMGRGDQSDQIPVYEFFHDRTDAVPDGRYIIFVGPEAAFIDMALPYRFLPLVPIKYADTLGTTFGYTAMFDLLPLQEGINMLNSVILSNQNAFGVQNVMIPKGIDINLTELAGGLNIIEYTPGLGKPEPLNLTQTPAEVFNMLNKLEATMETISGINSVARGNPEANLRSGNSLALVQAQAIQYISGLQQSYIHLLENVGTYTIKLLQDFAEAPRVAAIAGKNKKAHVKKFKSDDLSSINRVIVDAANPISKTTAGKMEMANNLIQYQIIDTVEDYLTVMSTGNLDTLIEGQQDELFLISSENEKLMEGENVPVMATDSHLTHIKKHKAVFNDPNLRNNPELMQAATNHILEHVEQLREVDPELLQILGEQPLSPPQPPQAPPGPPTGAPSGADLSTPPQPVAEQMGGASMPNLPAPAGNPDLPITATENMEQLVDGVVPGEE
jgi:hypothetical protein